MFNGDVGGVSGGNNNVQWNKQLAEELDAADGKKDGKISASIWNNFIDKSGSNGNKINKFINVETASKSLDFYARKKDVGNEKVDWSNWQEMLSEINKKENSEVEKQQQANKSNQSNAKPINTNPYPDNDLRHYFMPGQGITPSNTPGRKLGPFNINELTDINSGIRYREKPPKNMKTINNQDGSTTHIYEYGFKTDTRTIRELPNGTILIEDRNGGAIHFDDSPADSREIRKYTPNQDGTVTLEYEWLLDNKSKRKESTTFDSEGKVLEEIGYTKIDGKQVEIKKTFKYSDDGECRVTVYHDGKELYNCNLNDLRVEVDLYGTKIPVSDND